jgi:uncharacterized protein with HEPN domain
MTYDSSGNRRPERKELDRLLDIQDDIENIQGHPRYSEGKKAWDEDKYYRGYCERQLGIIGEAAARLTADFDYEKKHSDVPWRQIKALRNILVHMYWGSDPKILWEIVEGYVPDLKEKVDKWVKENDQLLKPNPKAEKQAKKEGKLSRRIRELADKEHPATENESPPKS